MLYPTQTIVGNQSSIEEDNKVNFSGFKDHIANSFMEEIDAIGEKIRKGEPGIGRYMEDGKMIYIGFAPPIKSKGWTLIVNIDESEALSGLKGIKYSLVLMVLMAIVVGTAFSLLFSRSLTKPIIQVTNRAYTLSQLDLSQDIDEKLLRREDELGKMANSLQVVIQNMRNLAQGNPGILSSSGRFVRRISCYIRGINSGCHQYSTKLW